MVYAVKSLSKMPSSGSSPTRSAGFFIQFPALSARAVYIPFRFLSSTACLFAVMEPAHVADSFRLIQNNLKKEIHAKMKGCENLNICKALFS